MFQELILALCIFISSVFSAWVFHTDATRDFGVMRFVHTCFGGESARQTFVYAKKSNSNGTIRFLIAVAIAFISFLWALSRIPYDRIFSWL